MQLSSLTFLHMLPDNEPITPPENFTLALIAACGCACCNWHLIGDMTALVTTESAVGCSWRCAHSRSSCRRAFLVCTSTVISTVTSCAGHATALTAVHATALTAVHATALTAGHATALTAGHATALTAAILADALALARLTLAGLPERNMVVHCCCESAKPSCCVVQGPAVEHRPWMPSLRQMQTWPTFRRCALRIRSRSPQQLHIAV